MQGAVSEGLRLVQFILGTVILDTWRRGVRMVGGVKEQRAERVLPVFCLFVVVDLKKNAVVFK